MSETSTLTFTVLGRPQPQGSIRAFVVNGRPRLTSDNAKLKPWRQDVGWTAADAAAKACWDTTLLKCPISVRAVFYLAKPKSNKKRTHPVTKPDVDKLCRALLDSMTGILFADDSQVVDLSASKRYELPERTEVSVSVIGGRG